MQKIKNEKGITLVILVVTVIVLALVSIPTTLKISEILKVNDIAKYKEDFTILEETVSEVYSLDTEFYDNGGTNYNIGPRYGEFNSTDKNVNDQGDYYVIDVNKLNNDLYNKTGSTMELLNFGKRNYAPDNYSSQESEDVYIINGISRTIYYVKGFYNRNDGKIYRYPGKYTNIVVRDY